MVNVRTGITIANWLSDTQKKLSKSPTANLDARLLLAHVLGWDQSKVLANPNTLLSPGQISQLERIRIRRRDGLPIAYITGYKDFADFCVAVDKSVLIPRPETESILIEAIKIARATKPKVIYEVGTGSGVLAIGLAKALPNVKIVASDVSQSALKITQKNVLAHGLDPQITLVMGDLGKHIDHAEMIVANLPYLPTGLKVSRELGYEPNIALWSGKDGLDHYRKLLSETSFDAAVIEFGAKQYQPLTKWLKHTLPSKKISQVLGLDGKICGAVIS